MRRVSHQDFVVEFPMTIPGSMIQGIQPGTLEIDRDCILSGNFHGDVVIKSGAKVLFHGIINGNVTVQKDGVFYAFGITQGEVFVHGAASIHGILGSLRADEGATVAMDGIARNREGAA